MKIRFLSFFILLTLSSCIKDVDYDQLDNIDLEPTMKVALVYANLTGSDFQTTSYQSDITEFDVFDNDYAQDDVVKLDLLFGFENNFNKDFDISFEFLDKDLNLVTTLNFLSKMGTTLDKTVVFEDTNLKQLLQARAIRVSIQMVSSSAITSSEMSFKFKSATNVYFKI